jgi:hypothetical protein
MWQAEQGNLLNANDDLEKVRLICGTTCEPYKMLKSRDRWHRDILGRGSRRRRANGTRNGRP